MLSVTDRKKSPGPNRFRFPAGIDWIFEGVLNAEAGLDLLLASRAEPIPDLNDSLNWYRDDLDEMGVQLQITDDDTITAGLLRAAVHTGRKAVALFDIRGIRRAFDSIYEVTQTPIPQNGAAVLVACESRWSGTPDLSPDSVSIAHGDQSPGTVGNTHTAVGAFPPADLRDLACYLHLPVLAPSSPSEILPFVNLAIRISQAAQRTVMLLLTPALVGGGETPWEITDPAMRPVPTGSLHADSYAPINDYQLIIDEARKHQIDRLFNAPVPGETAPLGFVTFGTAHAALRHALTDLDLIGRIPILKLGMTNPVDPRSARQFLSRCREVVVVENGRPIVENQLIKIAQSLSNKGISTPLIINRKSVNAPTPVSTGQSGRLFQQTELTPSELTGFVNALRVDRNIQPTLPDPPPLKHSAQPIDINFNNDVNLFHNMNARRRGSAPAVPSHRRVWARILQYAFDELSDQLALPEAGRPPLRLRIDNAETTSFEGEDDEKILILMESRRLYDLGRSVIVHALRRSLPCTFLILPRSDEQAPIGSAAAAERMIRGMISDSDAPRITVGTCDPADRPNFQSILRREILTNTVSVLIIDYDKKQNSSSQNTGTSPSPPPGPLPPFPQIEYHIQPASRESSLHLEWLLRHGWDDPRRLDGVHAPKLAPPKTTGRFTPPFDAWDGFEEWRIYRKTPRLTRLSLDDNLPEPHLVVDDAPYWRAHLCGDSPRDVKTLAVTLSEIGMRMGFRIQLIQGRDAAGAFTQIVFSRPRQNKPADPISARIPDGSANLIISIGSNSLREALRMHGPHRAASPKNTHILFDAGMKTIYQPSSPHARPIIPELEDDPLREQRQPNLLNELRQIGLLAESVPLQHLCEEYFYQRGLTSAALIGYAFQRGWIPATTAQLEKTSRGDSSDSHNADETDNPKHLSPHNFARAVRLGRQLADNPRAFFPEDKVNNYSSATSQHADHNQQTIHPRTPEQLIKKHVLAMSRRRSPFARKKARQFEILAFSSLDAVTGLRRKDMARISERLFIARLIDCQCWGGLSRSRDYADRIRALYAAESHSEDYELTRIIINELARAMLWINAAYLCEHALRPERIRAMLHRLHVNRAAGDRYTFRIRSRTQIPWLRNIVGPYWKFTPLTAGITRHTRFLRYTPFLYKREKQYNKWILKLVDDCISQMPDRRSLWLEVFRQLARVHGPSPQRWRRLHRVRLAIQSLLDLSNPEDISAENNTT